MLGVRYGGRLGVECDVRWFCYETVAVGEGAVTVVLMVVVVGGQAYCE